MAISDLAERAHPESPEASGGRVGHVGGVHSAIGQYQNNPGDPELIDELLPLLADDAVDFTNFWRNLAQAVASHAAPEEALESVRDMFINGPRWMLGRHPIKSGLCKQIEH